ncbi:NUDIX domain-containing protein [Patescibacteria group bacterium]|nr:NUDIX domain-containing protein [Patescibacteria group bacterium]MBU1721843.1 NUDIX domain-containing protein [Patescibacteria group bacterium]MBU1901662.1 NUDIX domain-containing protein [Patescibacteria group bacterium]
MHIGKDCIGVGCGALIINDKEEVLLLKRGKSSKNEIGVWSKVGGAVEFGDTVEETLIKEAKEEIDCDIEIIQFINYTNHIIKKEGQHWVSFNFVAKIIHGTPKIMEPTKCSEMAWFPLDALPENSSYETVIEPVQIYTAHSWLHSLE